MQLGTHAHNSPPNCHYLLQPPDGSLVTFAFVAALKFSLVFKGKMNGRSWPPQDGECCFSDMARSLVKIMKGIGVNTIIYVYIHK